MINATMSEEEALRIAQEMLANRRRMNRSCREKWEEAIVKIGLYRD
jgi:hypothetical protein